MELGGCVRQRHQSLPTGWSPFTMRHPGQANTPGTNCASNALVIQEWCFSSQKPWSGGQDTLREKSGEWPACAECACGCSQPWCNHSSALLHKQGRTLQWLGINTDQDTAGEVIFRLKKLTEKHYFPLLPAIPTNDMISCYGFSASAPSGTTVTLASFSHRRVLFSNFLLCISLSWNAEHVLFNVRQQHSLDIAYVHSPFHFLSKPASFLSKGLFHPRACSKHAESTHCNQTTGGKKTQL